MALAPTEIQQQIDEKLLKLRQLHDDPNSDISPGTRDLLKKTLYDKNLLQRPTGPVTGEQVFPLSHMATDAMTDVYSGKFAPWDSQHPFISAGQKLREVAGAVPFISQPVAGALDVMALPIRAVGRPAIESALGQDPQLNFLEKSARSLQTDRDIGNVQARRTAVDFPSIVQKYKSQGMTDQQAADRGQGDLTRNWMLGGTAENIMTLLDPVMLTKLLGKAAPKAAAAVAGAPPVIPGMAGPGPKIPAPDFGPNVLEQAAGKQPPQMVATMDGMQPVPAAPSVSADTFLVPGGQGQLGFRNLLNKGTKSQPTPALPPLSESPFGPFRDQGQQNFDFTQGPALPQASTGTSLPVFLNTGEAAAFGKQNAGNPGVIDQMKAAYQSGLDEINKIKSLGDNATDEQMSQAFTMAQKNQLYREAVESATNSGGFKNAIEASAAQPTLMPQDNVIQVSAQMQREIDQIAKTPNGARSPAYQGLSKDQIQELFVKRVANKPIKELPPAFDPTQVETPMGRAKGSSQANLAEEFASPEAVAQRDKTINTTAHVADEMKRLRQEPNYYENFHPQVKQAVDNLVEEHFAATKTGNKAEVARIEKVLAKVMDDTGAVHPGMTPEKALEALRYPTPIEDLKTIIGGIEPAGGLNANVPRMKLTPEAKAAIQRWKDVHGPVVMASIKASGKDAFSFLKEQFPDVPDSHLRAMSKALEDTAVPAVNKALEETHKDIVPVTTKEGRGQYKGKVNLSVYSNPDVAGKIMDIVDQNPGMAAGMKLTDKDINTMASEITSGDRVSRVWKALTESPAGQLPAEIRAEGTQLASKIEGLLSTDFGKDVNNLKKVMDDVLAVDLRARTKVSSEMGRSLREFGLPVEGQKKIAAKFQELLDKYGKDPGMKQQLMELRKRILSKEFNPTYWDKAYYIWINGLLSGPKTQVVNTTSNALHLLNKFPDRALESLLDAGISLKTGARSTTMDEIPRMWKAMFSKDQLPDAFRYDAGNKLFENSKNISPLQGKFSRKLEPAMYGTKLLAKSDQFFGNKVAQMEHAALQGKGLTDMDMKNLISDEAALRTLTRAPAAVTKVLLFAKQNLPGFRWVAPFIRTSADIIGQATEHTPLGLYGIRKSAKAGTLTQRELAQRSARMVKGTLLGVWAYDQWKKGNLVGDAPKDTKNRQHFLEVQHKQENSLKIGNHWVPLASVEPVGSVLSEFVNFYEGGDASYKDSKSAANAFMSGVMKAGVALGNKRYLSGVGNVLEATGDPINKGPKVLGQIAAGFVPGAVKTVTDQMDTKVRKATTIPDMIKKRIPGASSSLPPVRDIFGRDTTKPSGFNLFNIKDATVSPEDKAVWDTPMSKPSGTISGQKLSPQEVALLQRTAGDYKKQMIQKFAPKLQTMSQDRRQYFIDQISSTANERARAEFMRDHPKYRPVAPFSK